MTQAWSHPKPGLYVSYNGAEIERMGEGCWLLCRRIEGKFTMAKFKTLAKAKREAERGRK
jgi:hypothetical protein